MMNGLAVLNERINTNLYLSFHCIDLDAFIMQKSKNKDIFWDYLP